MAQGTALLPALRDDGKARDAAPRSFQQVARPASAVRSATAFPAVTQQGLEVNPGSLLTGHRQYLFLSLCSDS